MSFDTTLNPAEERAEFEAARAALMGLGREEARIDAIEAVARLVGEADDLGAEGSAELLSVAQTLQDRRAFGLMLVLCLLARQAGLATPKLRQKEVQALIELGRLEEAVREARALAELTRSAQPDDPAETANWALWRTAQGNIGRAYKQAYVNAALAMAAGEGGDRQPDPQDLKAAVETYRAVWERHQGPGTTYHCVNAATLIIRAVRDRATGREGDFSWALEEDARRLAGDILRTHEKELRAALAPGPQAGGDVWTLATCGEAYLVLGLMEDAALCYGAYAGLKDADAFEIGSSLRQLEQVWLFDGKRDDAGGRIVRLLKGALLNLEPRGAGRAALDIQRESVVLSPQEAGLMRADLEGRETIGEGPPRDGYEAYFQKRGAARAAGGMVDLARILSAAARAQSVCAIETLQDGRWQRIGTGFAVRGDVLHDDWGDLDLIMSNHHVVAQSDGALSSSYRRCRANFVEYDPVLQAEHEHPVYFDDILWRSGERAMDTAVLVPRGKLPDVARIITRDETSNYLPKRPVDGVDGTEMHVVILGFPGGGDMQLSYGDEMLLDHNACEPGALPDPQRTLNGQPVRLHYRTPSRPGSSGSPVFMAGSWELVGIHHRGQRDCPRLPPKQSTYEANEGIWLPSIRAAIRRASLKLGSADTPDSGEPLPASGHAPQGELFGAAAAAYRTLRNAIPDASALPRPRASEHGGQVSAGSAPVIGRPIGTARQAAGGVPRGGLDIPGHTVFLAQYDNGDVADRYLKPGHFRGEMEQFRARTQGFETVIGDDNRTQIHDTGADPFRMICALVVHWPHMPPTSGTGFLVGQRTVLTAGHCILPGPGFPDPAAIEVRPGRSGTREPFADTLGALAAERISLHTQWSARFDPRFDVGAIHLDKPAGETVGWFRVGVRDPQLLTRHWAHVTGYPGDKITQGAGEAGGALYAAEQWHHATPIAQVHDGRVYYPADTFAGQSGAPVYILDQADGLATVIGVHAYGVGPNAGAFAMENNSAAWIDAAMLQVISDWRNVA